MDKISPIAAQIKAIAPIGAQSTPAAQATGADFAQLLKDALGQANQVQLGADQTTVKLAAGEVQDIHRAVMEIAQADLSFRYVLQVRNKIIDAYQEIMRMQI